MTRALEPQQDLRSAGADSPKPGEAPARYSVKRRLVRILALLALGYACYVMVGRFAGRLLIYPGAGLFTIARIADPRAEALTRETGGVWLEAWYYAPRSDPAVGLVVLFHGNGELIDHLSGAATWYLNRGYAVLAPEYRGYGGNGGRPSERAIVDDAVGWLDLVASRPEVAGQPVVLHGFSLGGGVACGVAHERPPAALLVSSTFRSMGSMFGRYGLPPFIAPDRFDNLSVVREFEGPVLVTHGRNDSIIPFSEGRRLAEVRPGIVFASHDGGHNDALNQDEHWEAVSSFLADRGLPAE